MHAVTLKRYRFKNYYLYDRHYSRYKQEILSQRTSVDWSFAETGSFVFLAVTAIYIANS
jgi:hypothetical protein